ncbi:MAG: FeoA family protein [Thermodesulfobacteriota bacterium]
MRLSDMREGQSGTIVKVAGSGAIRRRLLEMGFLKGKALTVEKYAPLRDPLEVVLAGCHVSLRVEEAKNITMDNVSPLLPSD